jgi:hypothetical protein
MTRKILLSVLLIAAVMVAVAGITFAVFSDNIPSDDQVFAAGTVDINVDGEDDLFETDLDMFNIEAGQCSEQTVTVNNTGSLDVNLWNWIYAWQPDGYPAPNIFSCDPNADCNMTLIKTFDSDSPADGEGFIASGGWEKYKLEACLPLCAGNNCQGAYGKMRMFFHAVQWSHLEGYECVKLMYKEEPDWIPDPAFPAHGNKCYQQMSTDGLVDFVVNGYELTADMPLQIMLNGPGGCSIEDKIIAGDFNLDGIVDPGYFDPYYRGFWTGSAMSTHCSGTGEGVYAIAHGGDYHTEGDPGAVTDANGDFSGQWTADFSPYMGLCGAGNYEMQAKFLVKQDTSPWLEELDELDYQYITLNCE